MVCAVLSSQQDIVASGIFALGFLAGGIALGAWAGQWGEWQDYIDDIEDAAPAGIDVDDYVEENKLYFDRIEGAMGTSAVSTL